MAKKTNKTNHVLNLLAGNGEAEEENVKQGEKPEKDAETNVQIVAPNGEDEEIAEAVNRLLDQELEAEMRGPEAVAEESEPEIAVEEPEPETVVEKAEEPEPETVAEEAEMPEPETAAEEAEMPEPEAAAEEEEMPEPESVAEETEEAEEPEAAAEEEEMPESVAEEVEPPEPETVAEETEEPEAVAEESDMIRDVPPNYVFVNVMEHLVREKIRNYMEEFGNCTCSRCVADATAVALTNLPAKYVVVNRDAKAPLMNFYAQRYAGQIMVEITKGCIRVKEHPHHDRD